MSRRTPEEIERMMHNLRDAGHITADNERLVRSYLKSATCHIIGSTKGALLFQQEMDREPGFHSRVNADGTLWWLGQDRYQYLDCRGWSFGPGDEYLVHGGAA
jgi:hypothetical protein